MNRFLAVSAVLMTVLPGLAMAQSPAPQTVTLNGSVPAACDLQLPTLRNLDLGALTDQTGRLDSRVTGPNAVAQTSITSAWCNAPSKLTVTSSPLSLSSTPGYALPANFSREITYTLNLTNWQTPVSARPLVANTVMDFSSSIAHAAQPMDLQISQLAPIVGGVEALNNFLEAGVYSSEIIITLSTVP